MGENSKIEWTNHTFNPWMGCTKVSEGCKNCYAENQMDHRWNKVQWGPGKPRVRTSEANWKKPLQWNAEARKTGIRPRVFCASLADWLDPEAPIEWLADLMNVIAATPHIDWLLLTKRPELWEKRVSWAADILDSLYMDGTDLSSNWLRGEAPPNVWIGGTVENQKATERISHLLKIPAQFHFLSCEPLLGQVGLSHLDQIDWVICGGESGPNARPMHPDWARSLRDQCVAAEVPFFFKQWGEWGDRGGTWMGRVGKKAAGRLLDGREWSEVPEAKP